MRGIISNIGSQAGLAADYWRGGIYVYEVGTKSKALIEQEMEDGWRGRIRLQTQGGQAAGLLARLVELVQHEQQRLGIVPASVSGLPRGETAGPLRAGKQFGGGALDIAGALSTTLAPVTLSGTGVMQAAAETSPPLTFAQEPAPQPEYLVSYAWKDCTPDGREREAIVDQLCAAAEQKGIDYPPRQKCARPWRAHIEIHAAHWSGQTCLCDTINESISKCTVRRYI